MLTFGSLEAEPEARVWVRDWGMASETAVRQ